MSYVYIRVRNSPAGRVKPIKMKCFNKKQEDCRSYDLNDDFSNVCRLFKSFLRKLRVKYLYYDMRIFKGVYKNYHYPYVQAYITDKNVPPYDNCKSKEKEPLVKADGLEFEMTKLPSKVIRFDISHQVESPYALP